MGGEEVGDRTRGGYGRFCPIEFWSILLLWLLLVWTLRTLLRRTPLRRFPLRRPPYARPPKILFFYSLSLSLGVFSLNFGGVFEGWGAQMCMAFGLSCETPAGLGPVWMRSVCQRSFRRDSGVLQSCPVHLKGRYWFAMKAAVEAVHTAVEQRVPLTEVRGWKLFSLLPFWLFRRPSSQDCARKSELSERSDAFTRGHGGALHSAAIGDASRTRAPEAPGHRTPEQRAIAACQKVRVGVSRARQCLTGAFLAFEPQTPVELDRKTFFDSLRSSHRGSSGGPGGCTYEYLKLVLDDSDATDLFVATCNRIAQGRVPEEVRAVHG